MIGLSLSVPIEPNPPNIIFTSPDCNASKGAVRVALGFLSSSTKFKFDFPSGIAVHVTPLSSLNTSL